MTRARDLGIPFEGTPGECNAITDVPGVTVGYATVIEGESARTGVTIIHPRGREDHDPVFAAWFPFNGNGEMTGSAWVEEGGFLEGPIGITNTHSVGVVRDAVIEWLVKKGFEFDWSLPIVAETLPASTYTAYITGPRNARRRCWRIDMRNRRTFSAHSTSHGCRRSLTPASTKNGSCARSSSQSATSTARRATRRGRARQDGGIVARARVYTDGACIGNPGPGGWAWAEPDGPFASGAEAKSTNQRMEIRAALEAVRGIEWDLSRTDTLDELVQDATSQRWGAFGEIGTSLELHADERKMLRAVGKAHLRTALPIFTHNPHEGCPRCPA